MTLIVQEGIDASQFDAGDEIMPPQDRFSILESALTAGSALAAKGDPAYVGNLQGVIVGKTAAADTDYAVLETKGVFALSVTATDANGNSDCAYGDMLFLGGSDGSLTITKNPEGRRFGVFISNTTLSGGSTGVAAVAIGFENVVDFEEFVATTEALVADGDADPIGLSTLNGTASCDVALENGANVGQTKMFRAITSIANAPTVTVATHESGAGQVFTFPVIGDSLILQWDGLQWVTIGGNVIDVDSETLVADGVASVSIPGSISILDATGASVLSTLADGGTVGQEKILRVINVSNQVNVTIATHELGSGVVYEFTTVGDTLTLVWDGLQWVATGGTAQLILEEALSSDGAASLLLVLTTLDGTASMDATLADGLFSGQRKIFRAVTSIANPPTIAITTSEMGTDRAVYTLNTIGDSVIVEWDGLQWMHIAGLQPVETAVSAFTASPFYTTDLDSNGGAVTVTLGDGAYVGQIKRFTMGVDGSSSSTVNVTNHDGGDPEVITLAAIDAACALMWTGSEWSTLELMGATV